MKSFIPQTTFKFTLLILLATACGQRKEPVPEYFGVYALDNGALYALKELHEDPEGPRLSPDARFIVYQPDTILVIAPNTHSVSLREAGLIRYDLELRKLSNSDKMVIVHETSDSIGIFSKSHDFLIKPGQKEGSLEFSVADPLPSGLYIFDVMGDLYAVRFAQGEDETFQVYDRYYETAAGQSSPEAMVTALQRGMHARHRINNHFITNEFYRPAQDLEPLLEEQRNLVFDQLEQHHYQNAFMIAREAAKHFPEDQDIQKVLRDTPIQAMDFRDNQAIGNWNQLKWFLDNWIQLTDGRDDVAARATQLVRTAKFDPRLENISERERQDVVRRLDHLERLQTAASMIQGSKPWHYDLNAVLEHIAEAVPDPKDHMQFNTLQFTPQRDPNTGFTLSGARLTIRGELSSGRPEEVMAEFLSRLAENTRENKGVTGAELTQLASVRRRQSDDVNRRVAFTMEVLLEPRVSLRHFDPDSLGTPGTNASLNAGEGKSTFTTDPREIDILIRELSEIFSHIQRDHLPPVSSQYIWMFQRMMSVTQNPDVGHALALRIQNVNTDRVREESPLFNRAAVSVEFQSTFSTLRHFVRTLMEQELYASITQLRISTNPSTPETHTVYLVVEWLLPPLDPD